MTNSCKKYNSYDWNRGHSCPPPHQQVKTRKSGDIKRAAHPWEAHLKSMTEVDKEVNRVDSIEKWSLQVKQTKMQSEGALHYEQVTNNCCFYQRPWMYLALACWSWMLTSYLVWFCHEFSRGQLWFVGGCLHAAPWWSGWQVSQGTVFLITRHNTSPLNIWRQKPIKCALAPKTELLHICYK